MIKYGGFEKDGEAGAFSIDSIIARVTLIYDVTSQLYELQDANKFALDNNIRIDILRLKIIGIEILKSKFCWTDKM
jgi:hypothetical protein